MTRPERLIVPVGLIIPGLGFSAGWFAPAEGYDGELSPFIAGIVTLIIGGLLGLRLAKQIAEEID